MKAHLLLQVWLLLNSFAFGAEPAQSNQARLIIYRTREFGGGTYNIKINDQKQGQLPTNRYIQVELPPGRIKIESGTDYLTYFIDSQNQTLWLDVQPGRTYYIKAVEEIDFLSNTLLMAPVGDEQAQRELKKIKPATSARAE